MVMVAEHRPLDVTPIRALMWPGPKDTIDNPYVRLVFDGMDGALEATAYQRWFANGEDRFDVIHIHWPEAVFWGRAARASALLEGFSCRRLLAAMARVRAQGGVAVWTVHNLEPHQTLSKAERRLWDAFFPRFRAHVDLCLHLSDEAGRAAVDAYPDLRGRPYAVTPHPHFRSAYAPPPDQASARDAVALPRGPFVASMLGGLRPSKGVLEVVTAFRACAQDDERLVIAGGGPAEYWEAVRGAAGDDGRIVLREGFISEEMLPKYFGATDLFVMNFERILNSGSVMLSLSMDTPVFCPHLGSLAALAGTLGPDWLRTFERPITPETLRAALDATRRRPAQGPAPLEAYDPKTIAAATVEAYRAALARRRASMAGEA